MEKYLMKYDVDGRLYLYLERSETGGIASFIKISDNNKLLRYDGTTKERTFTKYDCDCSLAHRFQADESWVTIVKKGCNISDKYDFPNKKAAFAFDSNGQTNLFTTSIEFTKKCTSILKAPIKVSSSNDKRYPHIKIPLCLSNSGLFMERINKNAREHINIT